ncbi:MAG TPA: amino acid ABC transporter permease [Paracoccus sp. (in: a-proteobacteria)]|uniref:amino acid ABC transporter permease n=1 Tax=Paracoccus sp. TaxID=267 RepID=UPI002BDC0678|nr:amino acid ABC transporter permease [Paracoccus sp. (in: a-proteobacteria)]HWL58251.1 amino acid ABC transporter permease [Paracoccus sp. (in: a-proteobacteria)]
MRYDFDFSFLADFWPELARGAGETVLLSSAAILSGFVVGTALAVARVHGKRTMSALAAGYVEIIRNTPLVVQAFWLFFGLAALGLHVPAFQAAIITLVINVSAYTAEIIRAGMESIPKGQHEAADCLALSRTQVLFHVELPQAIERVYPALISQFILMMLASSIMSQISVEELTGAAYGIQSITFRGFEIYIVVAVIYLLLSVLMRLAMEMVARAAFTRRRRLGTPL